MSQGIYKFYLAYLFRRDSVMEQVVQLHDLLVYLKRACGNVKTHLKFSADKIKIYIVYIKPLDNIMNPLLDFKKYFCVGNFYESLAMLEGKTRKGLFF